MCKAFTIYEDVQEERRTTNTMYKCNILKRVTKRTDNRRGNTNTVCYEYAPYLL
ncbi:unnamed protein product [Nippostrongylus brasiliensis]|uniref:Ovule protein n=1 Tax=Nippostrongylus brasiliensis TaxID=27835 RepID=A0A0N4XCL7_NIPBR|nr:unnamed protein product [Nippostrongylus brasiliensis]